MAETIKVKRKRNTPQSVKQEKVRKLVKLLLSGETFKQAYINAGYLDTNSGHFYQLRKRPDVAAAIEKALESNDVDNHRIIAGVLDIAEGDEPARERVKAWEILARVKLLVDESKRRTEYRNKVTVRFPGVEGQSPVEVDLSTDD